MTNSQDDLNGKNWDMNERQFDVINHRMDTMESKIDRITDALIQLARTEERILQLEDDKRDIRVQLNRHGEQISELQTHVLQNSNLTGTVSKIAWIIGTAIVSAYITAWIVSNNNEKPVITDNHTHKESSIKAPKDNRTIY